MGLRALSLCLLAFVAAACGGGGGGGGGGSSPPPPPPPPLPSIVVTLTPSQTDISADPGEPLPITFEATFTVPAGASVVPDLLFDPALFALSGVTNIAGGVRVVLDLRSDAPQQLYQNFIRFRLCETAACARIYPDSTRELTYRIDLELGEWRGFHRDARAANFVPITLDPSRFVKAWERAAPTPAAYVGVATEGGQLATIERDINEFRLVALRQTDGAQAWSRSFPRVQNTATPLWPVTAEDQMIIGIQDHAAGSPNTTTFYAHRASDGASLYEITTDNAARITIDRDRAFITSQSATPPPSGFPLWDIRAGPLSSGAPTWTVQAGEFVSNLSVDGDRVYYHNVLAGTSTIAVRSRTTGALLFEIADPHGHADRAPILTRNGALVLNDVSQMNFYSLTDRRFVGSVSGVFRDTSSAAGNNKIYACETLARFMVIDESTRNVELTRPFGSGPSQEYCGGRVVATNNLVFVSTSQRVYALDANANIVWTHEAPGLVTISPEGYLLILEAPLDLISLTFRDADNIVAYRYN